MIYLTTAQLAALARIAADIGPHARPGIRASNAHDDGTVVAVHRGETIAWIAPDGTTLNPRREARAGR